MCDCQKLKKGVQLFRVNSPKSKFKELKNVGPDYKNFLGKRKVWQCKKCNQLFAYMVIPYKDEEEFVVRAENNQWKDWDWIHLSNIADSVRWNGLDSKKLW